MIHFHEHSFTYISESFASELTSANIVPLSFGILKNCLKTCIAVALSSVKSNRNGNGEERAKGEEESEKISKKWYHVHKWVRSPLIPNNGGIVPDSCALLRQTL